MTRRINAAELQLIKQWEGLKLKAYRNFAGEPWTIGYGHTSAAGAPEVYKGMVISEDQAEQILRADLRVFEERVDRLVKVPLTENQFATLVSFDFNTGALHKSTLLKKLNARQYDAVPVELMKWVNAGGKRVQGLVNRRSAEAGLWAKGDFVSSNFVEAKPTAPAIATKENISWGAGIVSSLGFAFTGDGPLQYALAVILVIAFAVGAYLFIKSRVSPS
jgi:lysozyme